MTAREGWEARLRDAWLTHAPPAGEALVVALSGGLDSVVLLHLLRFRAPLAGVRVEAAHFDHAMRPESADDASWVAGLCRAWGVTIHVERASEPPASEGEARRMRYDFLERVRLSRGARLVATAHHADDQAETVLFRAVRGTGPAGLAAMAPRREPGIWRPLLTVWREDLEAYAERAHLSWRQDPTNRELRYARSALRTRVLPDLERLVAPGARGALVRLADLARAEEEAWDSLLPLLAERVGAAPGAEATSVDRSALLRLHPAVQARILRYLLGALGAGLDEAATRRAVSFAALGGSGRTVELTAGWTLRRELDRLVLLRAGPSLPPDQPLVIPGPEPGRGEALVGGERVRVSWGIAEPGGASVQAERFDMDALRFPLLVRGRAPGDRIRLPGGTKKVKKLFLERRIPATLRARIPLLVDAKGDVLWIPRVARAEPSEGDVPSGALRIGIT